MSLRREVHSVFDEIAPPLGGMPERVVQTVLADHNARRRKERMLVRLRAPLSLVAVFLFIALVAAALIGGRLLGDWHAFQNTPGVHAPQSQLAQLEARPLHLPAFHSYRDCMNGPYNSEGSFGSGPIFGDGGPSAVTKWGLYFYVDLYADVPIDGPVLLRVRDLFKPAPIVVAGDLGAGYVLGTDVVDGKRIDQHSEAVFYASQASSTAPAGWIRPVSPHPYIWYVMTGARNDWSGSTGWQFDGLGFSEVFVAC